MNKKDIDNKISDFENVIATYKINKPKIISIEAENKSLPTMLNTFRKLIKNGIPPTQDEFVSEFKKLNPDITLKGLNSRLWKAYLSFVREYHLGLLLKKHFNKVIYKEEIDISGIDYIIIYKRHAFNIHAFIDTDNSRFWRSVKDTRHTFSGTHIDLPLDLSKGKRVGKFILYTDNNVYNLKSQMEKFVYQPALKNEENLNVKNGEAGIQNSEGFSTI